MGVVRGGVGRFFIRTSESAVGRAVAGECAVGGICGGTSGTGLQLGCHSRESGNPAMPRCGWRDRWVPAFAGMTASGWDACG